MKKFISNIKNNKLLLLFSILESFLQIYGFILSNNGSLIDFNIIAFIFTLIFSFVFFIVNNYIFKMISFKYKSDTKYIFSKKKFIKNWIILFVLWIPVLLAYYPTLWAYDVYRQVPHIIGGKLSSFQPIFHTLFIELFLIIGKKVKSYYFGMLLLSLVQMLTMSCIFSYAIEKIKTMINNKILINIFTILLIIYYGLIPFNSILSISMTKDVLFSGFLLLLIMYLYNFIDNDVISKKNKILFVLISLLILLIKNNSVYVYIIFTLVAIFYFKDKKRKVITILCSTSIFMYFIIFIIFCTILKPVKAPFLESYSVQVQNLMYVSVKHEDKVLKNGYLVNLFPRSCFYPALSYSYDKNRADEAKEAIEECELDDINDYKLLKTWVSLGIKYPVEYIDSWSNLTIGSWYLFDESHANTYPGVMQGYLLTDFKNIKEMKLERPKSKFPWLIDKLEMIATDNVQYNHGVIFRFIFAPATYVLSFFLMIVYIIKNKLKEELIPLTLLLALYTSILFGPVILVRYIYPYMVLVPIIFIRLTTKKKFD